MLALITKLRPVYLILKYLCQALNVCLMCAVIFGVIFLAVWFCSRLKGG